MRSEGLISGAAGTGAAILLGIVLVPFRELTPSSNLAFVFLALVIAVAEYGGRVAALATAVASSLSLNFFLTEPYLRLTIHGQDDVIAFLGLAACGLLAAALGGERAETAAALERERAHGEILGALAHDLTSWVETGSAAARTLRELQETHGIAAAVLRDAKGNVLAATRVALELDPPAKESRLETFAADGGPVSPFGERVVLETGTLDLWGARSSDAPPQRGKLADVARLLALLAGRTT